MGILVSILHSDIRGCPTFGPIQRFGGDRTFGPVGEMEPLSWRWTKSGFSKIHDHVIDKRQWPKRLDVKSL